MDTTYADEQLVLKLSFALEQLHSWATPELVLDYSDAQAKSRVDFVVKASCDTARKLMRMRAKLVKHGYPVR